MKTLKLRIKDKHATQLNRLSSSVNFVWNYVNDLGYKYLQRTGKFLSAYDLNIIKNAKIFPKHRYKCYFSKVSIFEKSFHFIPAR